MTGRVKEICNLKKFLEQTFYLCLILSITGLGTYSQTQFFEIFGLVNFNLKTNVENHTIIYCSECYCMVNKVYQIYNANVCVTND